MRHRIAVLAFPGVNPFQLSVPSLVFGSDLLPSDGGYEVLICAEKPGALPTDSGIDILVPTGLEGFASADTIIVPSWRVDERPSAALIAALRIEHARGARIVGLCLGAFVLAAAGLIEGREATTHWSAADALGRTHPSVHVRADLLWSDHGDVVTSAGVAAAIDCCLHLLRNEHGAGIANDVARSIVLAPHREGSQAQFVRTPVPDAERNDDLGRAMLWALDAIGDPIGLDQWAAIAHQSRRSFTRNFRRRTGTSPSQWLLTQRLDHARILLEKSSSTIEVIAGAVGFSTAASLRQHFAQRYGCSPRRYRAAFREDPEPESSGHALGAGVFVDGRATS